MMTIARFWTLVDSETQIRPGGGNPHGGPPGQGKPPGGKPDDGSKPGKGGGWGKGGGGGGGGATSSLTLVGSHDFAATPASSVDFTFDAAEILLVLDAAATPTSAGNTYGIRLSDDGGSTFYATSGDYIVSGVDATTQQDGLADTMFTWGRNITASNTDYMLMRLFMLTAAQPAHAFAVGDSQSVVGGSGSMWAHTKTTVVGPFDALRFVTSAGTNVTAGNLYVYKRVASA
jgi:hypothetical protein